MAVSSWAAGRTDVKAPGSRRAAKPLSSLASKSTTGRCEDELHRGILHDELEGLSRELVVHGNGDETGAHGPQIGGEELRAVAGEDGHRVAGLQSAPEESARAGIGETVQLAIGVLARMIPVEAIDHRDGIGGPRSVEKVAQIDDGVEERAHGGYAAR